MRPRAAASPLPLLRVNSASADLERYRLNQQSHMVSCQSSLRLSALVKTIRDRLDEKRPGFVRASSTGSRSKRSASLGQSEVSDSSSRVKERKPEVVELFESDDSDRPPSRVPKTPATSRSVEAPLSFSPFRSPSPSASTHGASSSRLSPPPRLDLSRFVHEEGASRSSQGVTSGSLSRKPSSIKKLPIKAPDAPVKPDILRKLKKCVLCGEDWSVKTRIGRTKWVRLQSVRLIKSAADSDLLLCACQEHTYKCSQALPEALSLAELGELMEKAVMPPPTTLLDSVVPHRKKPTRKGSGVETSVLVAGSEVGRDAIMDRVGQVLDEFVPAAPLSTTADEGDMQPPPFPTTQAFSTSGLGARFGAGRMLRLDSWENGGSKEQSILPPSPPRGKIASASTVRRLTLLLLLDISSSSRL